MRTATLTSRYLAFTPGKVLVNRLTGQELPLGAAPAVTVDVDTAAERYWIQGWRMKDFERRTAGCQQPDFDDAKWDAVASPIGGKGWKQPATKWFWARTHVFLPVASARWPVALLLGGWGVGDYRYTRVFVNGQLVGERRTTSRWFAPGEFALPATCLRFGQDNVIAIELNEPYWRPPCLDQVDVAGAHSLPWPGACTPPYQQCVVLGTPTRRATELRAQLAYRFTDGGRTILRSTRLTNTARRPVRLERITLGHFRTGVRVSEGEMGFPVYAADHCFFSLDHPAGWARGEDGEVQLCQYPGVVLAPGESFVCMGVVIGVADRGQATTAFGAHLERRMRRVVRHHDRPYAIFELFGAWPTDQWLSTDLTATYCIKMARRLAQFQQQTGQQFDLCSIDFWCDPAGDLVRFRKPHFPHGFAPVRQALQRIGVTPGLWIDSSCGPWSIGQNPVVEPCRTDNAAYAASSSGGVPAMCRATDPLSTMFTAAFRQHVREHGARCLKFDNLVSVCYNVHHAHWPGIYSTEAIYDSVIGTLRALDAECPELLLLGYWGYRSPWWLRDCDLIFECGLFMEAASPSPTPSLYARDGVSVALDQGTLYARDVPRLGKDSLGVWLSSWGWNSGIGTERWQEAIIMDLCRGNLLMQPWSDASWLTPRDRRQFAHFLALLRANPACFRAAQLVLGDPWKHEPYGYRCAAGDRAFIALNNCTWADREFVLPLPPGGGAVYRHYPAPARLQFPGDVPRVWLRPFDVALYEVVPAAAPPTAMEHVRTVRVTPFGAASTAVPLRVTERARPPLPAAPDDRGPLRGYAITGTLPAQRGSGLLVLAATVQAQGRAVPESAMAKSFAATATIQGRQVTAQPVLAADCYPASWQAWRVTLAASAAATRVVFRVGARRPAAQEIIFAAYFVPSSRQGGAT